MAQKGKGQDNSSWISVVDSVITDVKSTMNGLDFLDSPQGPRITLLPVQRILFKAILGIPMDYKEQRVPVWDDFRENILCTLKETEYIAYEHSKGKINFADWRDLPARGFNECLIIAGRRGGKAFEVTELIPTPDRGMVQIGDLRAGDKVFGPDGQPTQVLYAHEPFTDQTYRVTFDDGTSVLAHGGHLWHTYTKLDRKNIARRKVTPLGAYPAWNRIGGEIVGAVRTTDEIRATLHYHRPDGKLETNHSIPLALSAQTPEVDLPVDPYYLGLWLGDGSKDDTAITTMDTEIADYIQQTADGLGLKVSTRSNGSRATTYYISSQIRGSAKGSWGNSGHGLSGKNPLRSALRGLGVWENKHIPEPYLWASAEQRLALLQGLMDTDGCCARSRCDFTNTNEVIARGVYHLAASLGLKPYWGEGRATLKGKDCGPKYRVTWTATLPVFRLPRKLDTLPKTVKPCQNSRFIVSVEPEDVRQVRCITVDRQDGLFLFGRNFNITHNSQLVSALATEKLRQLLSIRSPQLHYRLVDGSPIDFTLLAQDEDGAERLYNKIKADVNRAEFFRPYLYGKAGTDSVKFITEADRFRRDVEPSIEVASWPCTTRAARGPSSYFLALDEFAHFRSASGASSDEVYESATPSTARFLNDAGELESLTVTITSPWTKVGKTWQLYNDGMREGPESGILVYRCSSAEMAGKEISPEFLRTKYKRDSIKWTAEYGGQFLESAGSFVPTVKVDACVDKDRLNAVGFDHRRVGTTYFWGTDLGFSHDATALAICHWEQDAGGLFLLVYDYINRMMVGEKGDLGDFTDHKQLLVGDVLDWFWDVNQMLPGRFGYTDQYAGAMFTQLCKQRELDFIELVHLTSGINSEMYYALQGYINQEICRFPNVPKFLHEIGTVEAFYVGKHQISVKAPNEKDAHDDMCDAVALAAWGAQKWMLENKTMGFALSGSSIQFGPDMLRPGDMGINPELATLSQLRVAERMREMKKVVPYSGNGSGYIPPRSMMRGRR